MIKEEIIKNAELSFIMDLNDEQKFFIWLYIPIDILSIDKIIFFAEKLNLPNNIILLKILSGYLYNEFDEEKVINYIIENKILNKIDISFLKKMISEAKLYKFNPINANILKIIVEFSNSQIIKTFFSEKIPKICYDQNNCPHIGYPLPDKQLGRPRLEWKVCYYNKCHKYFNNIMGLKTHLTSLGKLTHGFHQFHEISVKELKLTPEKIIKENLAKCPSLICDKKNYIFRPEELINHFEILGIEPFWKQGMSFNNEIEQVNLGDIVYKKIYIMEECLICLENKPMILFLPCYHNVICINCILKVSLNFSCPVCRNNIDKIIPF